MRAAIIPPEKLAYFDRPLAEELPFIQVGPVLIHSGPHAGSYAVNEAILESSAEWRALKERALAYMTQHGVVIEEIDPNGLGVGDADGEEHRGAFSVMTKP